jgi:hypothetical protein
MASMLQTYQISPPVQINRTTNGRQKNRRGYYVNWFIDAWRRYCPEAEPEPESGAESARALLGF